MFTKLNRVLLASGLAVASAALLSPSAFAESANGSLVVTGTPAAFAAMTVTASGNIFAITYNTGISAATIANVAYSTNVLGNWNIKVAGDSDNKTPGQLEAAGLTATIPFTVVLGGGTAVAPGATANPATLKSGNIAVTATTVVDTTEDLQINILANDTKVPTATADGSAYTETLNLTFSSGQI